MTPENVKQSLASFIESQVANHSALTGVAIVLNGETDTVDFPLVAIIDTGSTMIEQDGVLMRGNDDISINVETHSIPETEANGGTTLADHRAIAKAVYQILGDDAAITYCDGLNDTTIFDIRTSNPTMDEQDGRRVSTMQLTVIACPLSQ